MKSFCLCLTLVIGCSALSLTGCSGGGENEVIAVDPDKGGLGADQQQQYEEAMKGRTERTATPN